MLTGICKKCKPRLLTVRVYDAQEVCSIEKDLSLTFVKVCLILRLWCTEKKSNRHLSSGVHTYKYIYEKNKKQINTYIIFFEHKLVLFLSFFGCGFCCKTMVFAVRCSCSRVGMVSRLDKIVILDSSGEELVKNEHLYDNRPFITS